MTALTPEEREKQRAMYEASIVARMKEAEHPDFVIRSRLLRAGDGYSSIMIDHGWEVWQNAVSANIAPQPWKEREGFTFDLDAEMVERLDALAKQCEKQGFGMLASANYHGQGQVAVPALWLRQLIESYRATAASAPPALSFMTTAREDESA